jgi:hypothetical protein
LRWARAHRVKLTIGELERFVWVKTGTNLRRLTVENRPHVLTSSDQL